MKNNATPSAPQDPTTQQDKCLDQFYTQDSVALTCLDHLISYLEAHDSGYNLDDVTFFEPSAGDGAFLRALQQKSLTNLFACDLDPQHPAIARNDFLKDDLSPLLKTRDNILVIGNPPFGRRARLAAEFINRATQYSDTIAFILPLQFQKYSAQNKLIPSLRLVFDEPLKPSSFVFNGKPYSVRCCFQIWTTRHFGQDLRLRTPPVTQHQDFDMWQYNNTKGALKYFDKKLYQWDFAIPRQGFKDYTLKETDPDKMDRHTQWIFFKAHTPESLERLQQLDYEKLSRKNTSIPGFGKADVIKEYNKLLDNDKLFNTLDEQSAIQLNQSSFALNTPRSTWLA